ncbi:MAG: acyl carrier protein [Clostridium sp.]|nr:acyl carrier protein [Clostridium sp.]MCM1398260.1 acyl carrier protein [Clostridium sp.]MCM1459076.1 acyl carrier protein [Bacteroides sp.]
MTREKIMDEIKVLLEEDEYVALKDQIDELSESTSLIDDFAFDSLQILDFVVKLEAKFGFECESEELDLDMFDDLNKLIALIQKKLAEKNNQGKDNC